MSTRLTVCLLAVFALSGCSLVPIGNKSHEEKVYLLETAADISPVQVRNACTVTVSAPEAAPGFGGPAMRYTRAPMQIEQFAFSRWAESPASMIEPLLQRTLRATDAFAAVLPAPAPIVTDLRVESNELRLLQAFSGGSSEVKLSMSSRVYAPAERGLLASREFSYAVTTNAAGPGAGVEAANQAVAMLLADFASFVLDAAQKLEIACSP